MCACVQKMHSRVLFSVRRSATQRHLGRSPTISSGVASCVRFMSSNSLYVGARSWKSCQFVPQIALHRAHTLDASAFVADFQDAVPLSMKANARKGVAEFLDDDGQLAGKPVIIRLNESDLGGELDIRRRCLLGLRMEAR